MAASLQPQETTSISKEPDERSDESHETEELRIRRLRERAEDEALTYIFQNEKCLEEDSLFYPMYEATVNDGEYYAYCLVDSTSYKLYEVENFKAFIRSVRYIGKGKGSRGLSHPFERTKNVNKISKCQKMWETGAKVTTVCLTFYSEKRALQVEALMLEAFGTKFKYLKKEYRRLHTQLWNSKWEHYNGLPTLKDAKKKKLGVQLLHTAWKVYVDKPVVLEMMLSHPYSDAIRIAGKKLNLLKAAQELCDEARKQRQIAKDRCRAATDQYHQAFSLAAKIFNKIEVLWMPHFAEMNLTQRQTDWLEMGKKLFQQELVQDEMKDSNGETSANKSLDDFLGVPPEKENMLPKLILNILLLVSKQEDATLKVSVWIAATKALLFAEEQLLSAKCYKKRLREELFRHT